MESAFPLILAAAAEVTRTYTTVQGGEIGDALKAMTGLAGGFVVAAFVTLTGLMPFVIYGCYNRLVRLEKLQRRVADDVLAELRRINGPRQGPPPHGLPRA